MRPSGVIRQLSPALEQEALKWIERGCRLSSQAGEPVRRQARIRAGRQADRQFGTLQLVPFRCLCSFLSHAAPGCALGDHQVCRQGRMGTWLGQLSSRSRQILRAPHLAPLLRFKACKPHFPGFLHPC